METTTPKSWARAVHIFILATLLFSSTSLGHMVLSEPPPIQYKTNPFFDPSKADFDYTAPLSPSGSNYPCRSHLKYLDTPMAQSVRTYQPGQTYELRYVQLPYS